LPRHPPKKEFAKLAAVYVTVELYQFSYLSAKR